MGAVLDSFIEEHGGLTGIQKLAVPCVERGENCLITAPTGSGKTEAAMVPLLDRIHAEKREGIAVIYITPLRALNRDMFKRMQRMCSDFGISIAVRHGDTKQSERSRQARMPSQVMITTPETLQSMLVTRSFSGQLANVVAVVVDEVHEVYGNKRGAQLSVALERLERFGNGFQRIGLGATVGDPGTVSRFLSPNKECRIVSLPGIKRMDLRIELPEHPGEGMERTIERFQLDGEAAARLGRIAECVRSSKSTLIFTNTRSAAEALGSKLHFMNNEHSFGGVGVHHGSLNREERIEMEDSFKEGKIKAVVATSSLELGIDIGSVDLVLQYGSPKQSVRLLQRIGRSGHSESREARGVVIATEITDAMEAVALYSSAIDGKLERMKTQDNALDVLMHQACGILLDSGKLGRKEVYGILKRAYVFRNLGKELFDEVIDFMKEQKLIVADADSITAAPRTRLFYYGHVSFIPDTKRILVRDFNSNRVISGLDERFVNTYLQDGSVFITKGLPWKVISVEDGAVIVEPSGDFEAAIPDWSGEDIPVSKDTAVAVYGIFGGKGMHAGDSLSGRIARFVEAQNKFFVPSENTVTIEDAGSYKVVYAGLGTLANDALAKIISHFLISRLGRGVVVRTSPYLMLFEVPENINLVEYMKQIDPEKVETLLENSIARSDLFNYRFGTIAKFFGLIERDAVVSKQVLKRLATVLSKSPVYKETARELMHNYFDIPTVRWFIEGLRNGSIKVSAVHADSLCPFGDALLNSLYYTRELVMPITPNSVVVDSFMEHTMRENAKLVCTYCGMRFSRRVSELRKLQSIKCPSCGSNMVAMDREERAHAIDKRIDGKKLSPSEVKLVKEALGEASLIGSYGWRALAALGTYGIGQKTAARVLMMLRRNEKDFFCDVIEAQKQFIRTKKYWSV